MMRDKAKQMPGLRNVWTACDDLSANRLGFRKLASIQKLNCGRDPIIRCHSAIMAASGMARNRRCGRSYAGYSRPYGIPNFATSGRSCRVLFYHFIAW